MNKFNKNVNKLFILLLLVILLGFVMISVSIITEFFSMVVFFVVIFESLLSLELAQRLLIVSELFEQIFQFFIRVEVFENIFSIFNTKQFLFLRFRNSYKSRQSWVPQKSCKQFVFISNFVKHFELINDDIAIQKFLHQTAD